MHFWGALYGKDEVNVLSSPTHFKSPVEKIQEIKSGTEHVLLLSRTGKVYSMGSNNFGQIGHHERTDIFQPITFKSKLIVSVACGSFHSLALTRDGQIYSWGKNCSGQLGLNEDTPIIETPKLVSEFPQKRCQRIIQISAGSKHSMALADNGTIYVWGDNSYGQLGINLNKEKFVSVPQILVCMDGVVPSQIVCGGSHSLLITSSGAVFTWGKNSSGQLGHGTKVDSHYPKQARTLRSLKVLYGSCGSDHTVILTADGGVFSFGSGKFGQLGHGSLNDEQVPRKVLELMGSCINQIACGSKHTLVYEPNNKRMLSFGCGSQGQLGTSSDMSYTISTPEYIRSIECTLAVQIGAGGSSSYFFNNATSIDFRQNFLPQITAFNPEIITQIMDLDENFLETELQYSLSTIFKSPACINGSFLSENHFDCNSRNHGIDLEAWNTVVFPIIDDCKIEKLKNLVRSCIVDTIQNKLPLVPPDEEALRIFLILPYYRDFGIISKKNLMDLHFPYSNKLISLKGNPWKVLKKWFLSMDSSYYSMIVEHFKAATINAFTNTPHNPDYGDCNEISRACLLFLRFMNRLSVERGHLINESEFYIPEIKSIFNLGRSYYHWLLIRKEQSVNICNFPFIFDAEAKILLLQTDQSMQMHRAAASSDVQLSFGPNLVVAQTVPFLFLVVSRDNIVKDTLNQILMNRSEIDLKKPIRVTFVNEDAQDEGGVKKEFFMLLLKEILDPKYGMFQEYDRGCIWFSSHCFEEPLMFMLIGIICGLAIYNFTIINLPFPLPLYKKLLGFPVKDLEDLALLSEQTSRSLKQILDLNDSEEVESLALDFTINQNVLGDNTLIELKEDGANIPVTIENRQEYVESYIDHLFNKSVKTQYDAFHKGFHKVCGGKVLEFFSAQELMALIVGNENYDWEELEKNTKYLNGYSSSHLTIKYFWSVFNEDMTLEQRKHFLHFLTGSDRIPITGMKALQIQIQKTADVNLLPVAHTCFNLLDLPCYSSREILKTKLLIAIEHFQGFGIV